MKLSVDIVHHLRPHGPRRSLCRPLIEHKPHQHGTSLTRHAIESRQVHFTLVDYISLPVTPRFFSTEPCSRPRRSDSAFGFLFLEEERNDSERPHKNGVGTLGPNLQPTPFLCGKEMRYICRMFKMENGTTCGQGHPYPTRNYCMFRLPAAAVGAPSNKKQL